jgi:hypothetical protein
LEPGTTVVRNVDGRLGEGALVGDHHRQDVRRDGAIKGVGWRGGVGKVKFETIAFATKIDHVRSHFQIKAVIRFNIGGDAVDIFNLQHQLASIAKLAQLAGFDQIHNLAVVLTKLGARFFNCVENFCHDNVGVCVPSRGRVG